MHEQSLLLDIERGQETCREQCDPPPETGHWHHMGPQQRRYLPTLAELLDRLSIVTLKLINMPEHHAAYTAEREALEYDIDLILNQLHMRGDRVFSAKVLHAIMVVMLSNRTIWENEAKARQGMDGQDRLLKFTHSINGVRNGAKNIISQAVGERTDAKIDCFAEALIAEFGNWKLFK